MSASIPVHLVGESPNMDGVVTQLRDSVEAEGLPTDLPGAIEVDVSGLEEIDDTVWAGDLTMPNAVELLTDPEEPLVRLMAVRIEVEEVEEELEGVEAEVAEAAEEAGEGEKPEAADDE
jgi:large subunit ribosomal protein L25